ncbi:MAG: hypothetical protein HQM10_12180 [Candidatus Riflebacteria bacterium]|nr:hypothetical protein [Candidatus Riflebacteria bacterium]
MMTDNKNSMVRFIVCLVFVCFSCTLNAGVVGDLSLYFQKREDIELHSRNMVSATKELYRERRSLKQFVESSATLMQAYRSIKDKNTSLPQLADIAKSISALATSYQALAPKAEAMYQRIKPDMEFFASISEEELVKYDLEVSGGQNKFALRTIPDADVKRIAASAGWSKVWSSIKSDPSNIFRWGKLKDEYDYGKVEGEYAMKCSQICFEAGSLYQAAKDSMSELFAIKSEIDKIFSGDLNAVLNIGTTVSNVQNSARAAESLGLLTSQGGNHIGKRFDELLYLQDRYVQVHRTYQLKYANTQNGATSTGQVVTSGTQTYSTAGAGLPGQTGTTSQTPQNNRTGIVADVNLSVSQALLIYQTAYQDYTKLAQNPYAVQTDIVKSLEYLRWAKTQYDYAKARELKR